MAEAAATLAAPATRSLAFAPSRRWRVARAFARHRLAMAGLAVIVLLGLAAVFAPVVDPGWDVDLVGGGGDHGQDVGRRLLAAPDPAESGRLLGVLDPRHGGGSCVVGWCPAPGSRAGHRSGRVLHGQLVVERVHLSRGAVVDLSEDVTHLPQLFESCGPVAWLGHDDHQTDGWSAGGTSGRGSTSGTSGSAWNLEATLSKAVLTA